MSGRLLLLGIIKLIWGDDFRSLQNKYLSLGLAALFPCVGRLQPKCCRYAPGIFYFALPGIHSVRTKIKILLKCHLRLGISCAVPRGEASAKMLSLSLLSFFIFALPGIHSGRTKIKNAVRLWRTAFCLAES